MTIPRLQTGKFGVLLAERATGKVLSLDGERYVGAGEFYAVFDSLDDARAYATSRVEAASGIEASIRNSEGIEIAFVRKQQ
jgi:hypothetical protein